MNQKKICVSLLVLCLLTYSNAQRITIEKPLLPSKSLTKEEMRTWYHKDLLTDSIAGISTKKAYDFLKGKKSSKVIVAVIDSSVDALHEDLQGHFWKNTDEIPNNNIDDDNNGYIDDCNGWNFAGNLKMQNKEYERIIMNPKLAENKKILRQAQKEYKKALREAKRDYKDSKKALRKLQNAHRLFTKYFGKEDYTINDIITAKTTDKKLKKEIKRWKSWVEMIEGFSKKLVNVESVAINTPYEITKRIKLNKEECEKDSLFITGHTTKIDYRKSLGDDITNLNDKNYGNNKILPIADEYHSTHVAGIIVADRKNNKGAIGIAENTEIMAIRVSAKGDEHDKDVALAIRYAVDNGAKIINASFGKYYSPYKKWVFEAIQYAEKNDVLVVIGSGNDNKNVDKYPSYPNDTKDLKNEIVSNTIVVGASAAYCSKKITTMFSNYGKNNVDIFAPGFAIYSTLPNNSYGFKDGTSMAAPVVSGIAALIRSYYPKLTALQVKDIILKTGTKINFEVLKPGSFKKKIPFSELCKSSSIVNAYNAVKLSDKVYRK